MNLTDELIIERLNSINEDKMTEDIIIPLYKKKFEGKFHEFEFTGGKKGTEEGCDIVYYEVTHDTAAKEYTGIQVKQGDITSSKNPNTGIAAIEIQAAQAFSKKIDNIKDKAIFYIKTFVILTTGDVLPDARSKIVDRFNDKNIRFIVGRDIAKWIREVYSLEFISYFNIQEKEVPQKSLSPTQSIVEYLETNFPSQVESIQKSFRPYGAKSIESRIIILLLEKGRSKIYNIAREAERTIEAIEDCIREMREEDLVDADEDGIYLKTNIFNDYTYLKDEGIDRIEKLGYSNEVDINAIMGRLMRV
jgi:hypothetical protein